VSKVEKEIKLKVGKPFDVAELNASTESMKNALHQLGFALAKAGESARVDPSRNEATVQFEISPGPHCVIGEIRLNGLDKVPEDLVAREADFAKGKPYSPELITRLERRLIGLQVFQVVSVSPDTQLDENGHLGLEIAFVEGNTRNLKVGGGFAIEPDRWQVRATSQFSQHNLFGRLYDLRVRLSAGWAVLPYPWNIDSHGPVALFEPSIGKKGLLEKELHWRLTIGFEVGIEEDYKYMSPQFKLGVSRFLWDITLLSLSYNLEVYFLYGQSALGMKEMEAVGIAEDGVDRLAYLELGYKVMLIDQVVDETNVSKILDPENGAIFEVVYKIATPYLGGTTQYHDLRPSIRAYWQIFSHLQLAYRVETGFIFPFGDFQDPTVWSNYFLGGFNTVRAWGGKRLAPRAQYCVEGEVEDECDETRVGGWTMVLSNVELRAMIIQDLYIVAFFDMGDVQSGAMEYKPEKWNYTAGGGLRYASPVGKIRIDFGYRLNEPEPDWDEPMWGLHLGLGEAF
jgi:outer membrane protein assembly factor BamA